VAVGAPVHRKIPLTCIGFADSAGVDRVRYGIRCAAGRAYPERQVRVNACALRVSRVPRIQASTTFSGFTGSRNFRHTTRAPS
jgi:hypothetical protein